MEGASFLWAGGRAGRCQEAGGGLPGSALPGAVLRAGGRNGGVRSAGRAETGAESVLEAGWEGRGDDLRNAGRMVRWQAQVRAVSHRAVLLAGGRSRGARSAGRTEARSGGIAAGGAALDLALARETLRNPTPSRRRHQRGCSRAHDNAFAGGAVCLELGSPCLFCQTGLRLSGHCGAGWRWTAGARRWGGGVVEPDRWRCRGLEPAGGVREVPEDGSGWAAQAESIPLPRTMDGCLPAPASRSVAAGGRAVCRLVRRAVASPSFGSDEAGDTPGLGRPGVADVDQGDTPASPGVSGCRGDGVRPCGWGAVG